MQAAAKGDTVHVHYTGRLEDGSTFDSSVGSDPLVFTIGSGQVIPGFEEAIVGMEVGQTKTERIEAENAYGPPQEDLIFEIGRASLPDGAEVSVGDFLQLGVPGSDPVPVRVTEVSAEGLTLDANHPLAGKALVFELRLVQIEQA